MKRSLGLLLCLLALVTVSETLLARSSKSLVGQVPPEISVKRWFNGTGTTLAAQKGHVVVVEFWATWCGPCRASIPHLKQLNQTYKSKGVVLLSLTDEDAATVEPFIKAQGMDYTIGAGSDAGAKYGVTGIPHAVVIGKDGKVAWEGHPMDHLEEHIQAALK